MRRYYNLVTVLPIVKMFVRQQYNGERVEPVCSCVAVLRTAIFGKLFLELPGLIAVKVYSRPNHPLYNFGKLRLIKVAYIVKFQVLYHLFIYYCYVSPKDSNRFVPSRPMTTRKYRSKPTVPRSLLSCLLGFR